MDLVHYLCDIRLAETVSFLAERDIPFASFVESHHSIEACSRQKQEIKRVVFPIEPILDMVIVFISIFSCFTKISPFFFKICSHTEWGQFPPLYLSVEPDDMRIDIAEYGLPESGIESDHSSSHERFYPATLCFRDQRLDPGYQLRLDSLALDRGNDDSHPGDRNYQILCCPMRISRFPGRSDDTVKTYSGLSGTSPTSEWCASPDTTSSLCSDTFQEMASGGLGPSCPGWRRFATIMDAPRVTWLPR